MFSSSQDNVRIYTLQNIWQSTLIELNFSTNEKYIVDMFVTDVKLVLSSIVQIQP